MNLIEDLSAALGMSSFDVSELIATAPARYKTFTIAKRSGGQRTIAQPSRELKIIQRYILLEFLSLFPIHSACKAYVRGENILHNASIHQGSKFIVKLDFKEFFPSIVVSDWLKLARTNDMIAKNKVLQVQLSNILFWGQGTKIAKCLSIGAPSSPTLSNVIMFPIDVKLAEYAIAKNVNYTRYADDITASGQYLSDVLAFEKGARRIVAKFKSPKLVFNDEKRGVYGRGQRRMVTGLILTPTGKISIGRERKREISVMLHKAKVEELDLEKMKRLRGLLAFSVANEPEFIDRLRLKYGSAIVDRVIKKQF